MLNREPVEFVIAARDGFTRRLFEAACEKPGRRVRVGVDGGYGAGPDVGGFERVVLFAGGSGATFAFALACEWVGRFWGRGEGEREEREGLEVVWSVRGEGMFELSTVSPGVPLETVR